MPILNWLKARICSWRKDPTLVFLWVLWLFLFVFLVAPFLVILFSEDPEWAFCLFGVGEKFQILKFLGVAMGGVLLAIQAVTAYRRAKAMEKTAEQQAKTNENAEKGLRQERLKNAIEHMGHASVSVRLGGAYELFHLAEDTQELRQTVLDILCAHVRRTTGESKYQKECPEKPSEEIQSLLTLLFVQEHDVFQGFRINLEGSWLNGANLLNARLEGAHLWNTQLQGADLGSARLQGASLWRAQLQRAYLGGAHLQEANLMNAHLEGASLAFIHLEGASLGSAYLRGAELVGAKLQGAHLGGAHLQGTNLRDARLQGVNLNGVQLQGAVSAVSWSHRFAERMRALAGRESDLSKVIFEGGLTREYVDSILKRLPDRKAQTLREQLEPHIDKPPVYGLPKDSGARTGAYTLAEAEEWIAEYEKATSESPTPETDDKGGR